MPEELTITDATEQFRDAVIGNPALQRRLGVIEMPDLFEAEMAAAAAELGIALTPAAIIASTMAPDPLGLSRFQPAPVELDRWPETGWLPARSVATGGAPAFDWAWFGDRPLSEPFYEDTVRRIASRPLSLTFRTRTGLDTLIAGAAEEDTIPPHGFIFHMSRCGSTLAAQVLAAVPDHVVVSEPEPLDAVIQWVTTSGAPFDLQVTALRAIVAALGRNRTGSLRRYFLKLDAWHVLSFPLFRAAFPDTPWVFLYRDPEEVMVSHLRMPGLHFAGGGMMSLGLDSDPGANFSLEEHGARVLAQTLRAAAQYHALGGGMLVDYSGLPEALDAAIPGHFGFIPDAGERAAMAAAKSRDAKAPDRAFSPDSQDKRAGVTPIVADVVARHLRAPYEKLEILRSESDRRLKPDGF
ncbi:hypothetical protein [Sphingomonas koreensis]